MGSFWEWVWEDTRVLPKEETIGDGDNQADLHDRLNELLHIAVLSVVITLLRIFYERFIAVPFCKAWPLPDHTKRKPPQPNQKLEALYKSNKNPSQAEVAGVAKQLDMSVAAVATWFRRKRNWNRPSLQQKFRETSWRFIFYTFLFTFGMVTLWQSTWFWDTQLCWENFGHQVMHWPEYAYYMLESSFYLSLLFSVMTDNKRKDFTVQLIHHGATLFLIIFSYLMTFVRIGTLVMAVHDVSDIFLELGKCFHYFKSPIADTLFTIFAIVFIISRLVIYPFWVIHTSAIKSMKFATISFVWIFFNGLLIVLLCLHIFWASIIVKMARDMLSKGKLVKDDRSDTEEESDEDTEDDDKKRS